MHRFIFVCFALFLLLSPGHILAQNAPAEPEPEPEEKKYNLSENPYTENRTSVAAYGGWLTKNAFSELYAGTSDFLASGMLALSISHELISLGELFEVHWLDSAKIEVEGIGALHISDWPTQQTFGEFGALFALRWHSFPWNKWVDTTMGVGEGLSYVTPQADYERKTANKKTNLLNLLIFDITLAHPEFPDLALLLRLHHRSGAFSFFDGVYGGSNFFTAGLKYTF